MKRWIKYQIERQLLKLKDLESLNFSTVPKPATIEVTWRVLSKEGKFQLDGQFSGEYDFAKRDEIERFSQSLYNHFAELMHKIIRLRWW